MAQDLNSADFDVSFGYSPEHDDRYVLSVTAKNGTLSFQLALSADLIAPAVLAKSKVAVAMSPDGTLRIYADNMSVETAPGAESNLDDLIKQSIGPQMLEDEANAVVLLQTLKKRLVSSLTAVEDAISKLE